jgi:hypothetical protein
MVSLQWDQVPPLQREYIFHMNVDKGFREYGLRSVIETRNVKISKKEFLYPVSFSSAEEYVEIVSHIYDIAVKVLLAKHGDPRDPERLWREVMKQVKHWYGNGSTKKTAIPYEQSAKLYAVVIHSPTKETIYPYAESESGSDISLPPVPSSPKIHQHPCLLAEPVERDLYGPYIFFSHLPTGVLQYSRLEPFMAKNSQISDPVRIGRGFIPADPEEFSHFIQDVEHDVVDEELGRINSTVRHIDVFPLVVKRFEELVGEQDQAKERGIDEKWVDLYHVVVTNQKENGILERRGF